MSKQILFYFAVALISYTLKAQKGNNQVKLLAEVTIPIYQNDRGFGGLLKSLYGIGQSAQLTFTTGLSKFNSKNSTETKEIITRLIPVLAGYKQNIQRFYAEVQMGYGELGGKIDISGDYARPSVSAFFWAVAAGYDAKRVDIGARYQSAHGAGNASAGIWHNKNFHSLALYIGYNFIKKK